MTIHETLDAIYAELPAIECRGQCHDSCTNIDMTGVERRRIVQVAGVTIPRRTVHDPVMPCPALTMFKRCSVYEIRPLICRLWGLTRVMRCSYGCVPEGGYLPEPVALEYIARVHEAAGEHDRAAEIRAGLADGSLAAWEARQRAAANWREFNEVRDQRRAEAAS
ncbi:YkgJ family cysteine cluster protein [Dactylosporangium roseum]|uniref:YkgJ family cysteine cluster protein n=1 Tax=Dactylosporangium roseum TaxID=47989 RepID=A0ABY5Z8D5_9ACTN|nr:YkgJ family cysteine cluster protein [Dactylosporangium roseum]UWZ37909.1 YkgJ family cysteine cluster protein [Dactylosporangium roseum]